MNGLEMNPRGMAAFELPGIGNYYSLLVPHAEGVFQIDVRRVAEPASHTMPPEDARPATAAEALSVMGKIVVACLGAAGR